MVICDITMPEMNGHRVLETLRGDPRTAHLPFVFLTGWNTHDDMRAGMNGLAAKAQTAGMMKGRRGMILILKSRPSCAPGGVNPVKSR